jgi:integral membrane protein
MPRQPKPADLPRIPGALRLYQVSSTITGVFLLLLCIEMVIKYGFGHEIEMGGPQGILALVPTDTVTAVNLSTGILIAHGWFYVLYLFADFRLWSLMRWPFWRFVLIALGGVVPTLSFIVEVPVARTVKRFIAENTEKTAAQAEKAEAHS